KCLQINQDITFLRFDGRQNEFNYLQTRIRLFDGRQNEIQPNSSVILPSSLRLKTKNDHASYLHDRFSSLYYSPFSFKNFAKSIQRAEYPSSLSYHETTFTIESSNTIVDKPSTIDE